MMATGFWVLLVVAGLAAAVWRFGRCHHPGPLGLLPPTHEHDGTLRSAHWFCDACGRSWPAVFERTQRPIARFVGYDASKAEAAARRASDLLKRQRALAVKRSGITQRKPARRRPQMRPEPAPVVQIHGRRFGQ
jgi:hypothetical protein